MNFWIPQLVCIGNDVCQPRQQSEIPYKAWVNDVKRHRSQHPSDSFTEMSAIYPGWAVSQNFLLKLGKIDFYPLKNWFEPGSWLYFLARKSDVSPLDGTRMHVHRSLTTARSSPKLICIISACRLQRNAWLRVRSSGSSEILSLIRGATRSKPPDTSSPSFQLRYNCLYQLQRHLPTSCFIVSPQSWPLLLTIRSAVKPEKLNFQFSLFEIPNLIYLIFIYGIEK